MLSKQKSASKVNPTEVELQTFDFNHGLSSSTVKTSHLTLFQSNHNSNGADSVAMRSAPMATVQPHPPSLLSLNVDPVKMAPMNKNVPQALFPILKNNQPSDAK